MPRQALNFKHLILTDFVIKVAPSARSGPVRKAWTKADMSAKWAASAYGQRLAQRKTRAGLSDFDRFVVKVNRKKVGSGVVKPAPLFLSLSWWRERALARACVCFGPRVCVCFGPQVWLCFGDNICVRVHSSLTF